MVSWSQLDNSIKGMSCREISHPWAESCLAAIAHTWLEGVIGSAGFFGVFYLIQYLSRAVKKKKNKMRVKDILWMHLRSTLFGGAVTSLTFGCHCALRNLLGRFTLLSTVFIPAFIGGQSIFMENRKSREIFTNAFANCTLEIWLKLLERSRVLKWNPNIQTVLFMILSSLVSSLLSSTNFNSSYFWFFTPPRVNKTTETGVCFHEEECTKHISKLILMYSTTGFVLQLLKLLFYNFKNPKSILLSLKTPSTFTLAAFLGGYAALYQAIRCFLYQKEKKYSLAHDSLAGFLAGVTFRFQPTIAIFNSAIITTVQIFTLLACQKKILPNLPYLEVMFAFFCGVLFHQRLLGDFCPRLTVYFMSGVTHGLSDRIRDRFESLVRDVSDGLNTVKRI